MQQKQFEELKRIPHFIRYPQMIPFIGDDYDKTRLLILGESHYLPPKDSWRVAKWYESSVSEWLSEEFNEDKSEIFENENQWIGCTYTMGLVRSRAHRIYNDLENALRATGRTEFGSGLDASAYMNFFQRPAEINGGSIHNKDMDNIYAAETLQSVCEILKPTKIYFASTRAYNGLGTFINQKQLQVTMETSPFPLENVGRIKGWFNDALIGHGAHPASQWWNKAVKSYSKPRGQRAITGKDALRCFAQIQL